MTGCGWSGIKNWGMSWAMMKSHYQRGQKILKDDLKERKKKVKNSWTTLKSSPLFYLDLFKNDNGNCFFSNLRFLRFLHNFFLERKREMPSSIFYIVLTSWSNFLWIDDFFSFHNGAKKTCTFWIVTMSDMISRNSSSVCWNKTWN